MTGVEIDFVVSDSRQALPFYEKVFGVEKVEATSFDQGMNEAVFMLYGARFHMLDANPQYGLVAPDPKQPSPIWINIMVEDIKATFLKALESGCTAGQPVNHIANMGVSNAVILDPFGHQWLLHQMHRVVSFEEREQMFKDMLADQDKTE